MPLSYCIGRPERILTVRKRARYARIVILRPGSLVFLDIEIEISYLWQATYEPNKPKEVIMTPVHPDILAALTAGIQSEIASYVFYRAAAGKEIAAEHKELLEKLAYEEKDHFRILERQYDSLVRSEKWISTADILKQEGLPEISEEMSLEHKELIEQVHQSATMEQILDLAYKLEEDAATFFTSAMDTIESGEGRLMFEKLARFEEGHMAIIAELRKSILGG